MAEARARDEGTDLRLAFLQACAIPAAAVRLTYADLDRARSREAQAPGLVRLKPRV